MYEQLPIVDIIPDVKLQLRDNSVLILQAPPGAGKSTVLPLQLINEPWLKGKKIIMLEPRRLAAKSVANRMSDLLNESIGETIGYRIRFENKISKKTSIEVVTEGILTRMLQSDNSLEDVGLVIFDEFHERSLNADLALALCREAQQVLREDLRILIMSATFDGKELSKLLGNAPVLSSEGRQYPVEVFYHNPDKKFPLPTQVYQLIKKAYNSHSGDILVFLPGAGEIKRLQELLNGQFSHTVVLPMYGDLPMSQQQEAIRSNKNGKRKIVLATSIAETSLTIEGITVVIDSGYSRVSRFNQQTGLSRLETMKVTKDTADQRAGRAGRLGPGVCYRNWTEADHQRLTPNRTPEIFEADLAPAVLELASWGVRNINTLSWLTSPPEVAVKQAKKLLHDLKALVNDILTEDGKKMLKLPAHPRIAHLMLEAEKNSLIPLAADIAALLEERDPLQKEEGANIILRLEALKKWRDGNYVNADKNLLERIERISSSWRKIFNVKPNNEMPLSDDAGKLLSAAYPERIAKRTDQKNRYRLANGKMVKLEDYDPLSHEAWIVAAHLNAGVGEGRVFLASPLNEEDVLPFANEHKVVEWNYRDGLLIARKELKYGDIIIKTSKLNSIPEDECNKILCEVVRKEGLALFKWTDTLTQFQARVLSLKKWRAEGVWPDVSDGGLLENVEEWLSHYLSKIRKREDFSKLEMENIIYEKLTWPQRQELERLTPAKIEVPTGSMITLQYFPDGGLPVLAVRLQEVFGLLDTPTINEGRIKVMMHLLSPGYKPVQVTQDLRSFWKNTYPEVRKELRMRYPRHSWPEDPWTAEAVRGAKRRTGN